METLTLFSLFVIGLSYGATACMFSCMPFLSPLLLGDATGVRAALKVLLPFSAGRVFSYTLLAVIAYAGSALAKDFLNDNSRYVMILGVSTMLMGVYMFYRTFRPLKGCSSGAVITKESTLGTVGLFAIGASMSVNPCAPLMTLVVVAANAGSYGYAAGLGISFGLGAVAFSILFYGFIVSTMIKGLMAQFSAYKKGIERFAALMLMVLGVLVLNGKVVL